MDRRDFLKGAGSCAVHLALAAAVTPRLLRASWAAPRGYVVAREPFGSLERVADNIWALISTPLEGDRTTLSNGGIIAGRSGVLAIEGFNQPAGATWLATKAKELTGRWPTHVVVTHYHADHSNGVGGYVAASESRPVVRATDRTRQLVTTKNAAGANRSAALADDAILSPSAETRIDLGGRSVRLVPREGHTESDVTVEVDDPSVVFTGDLVWNAMFPNYVDAVPSHLASAVRAIRRRGATTYVPGHGPLAREADYDRYAAMLDEVERAARDYHAKGLTPQQAGAEYSLPQSLGSWVLFNKAFFERAFSAWYRELGG